MKKITYLAFFIFLCKPFIVLAEENPTTLCLRNMQSFAAIGSQLRHNPNLKLEDLNNIADRQTSNLKLKEFLRLQLVPRLLDKNPEVIHSYIQSKDALNQCELSITRN
jgi:hypothetical protein